MVVKGGLGTRQLWVFSMNFVITGILMSCAGLIFPLVSLVLAISPNIIYIHIVCVKLFQAVYIMNIVLYGMFAYFMECIG